jgi:superfamily II DNA helicase RecQ
LEPEHRNLSKEARDILQLLDELSLMKSGRGVSLLQLSELYRGSKAKSFTKFLDISKLSAYGSGKKYKKADLDRVMHALVFEGLLQEISQENGSGFNSDYLQEGPKAQMLKNGQFQFFVDFPSSSTKAKTSTKKKTVEVTSKTSSSDKTPHKKKKSTKTTKKAVKVIKLKDGKFQVPVEILDDSDDDVRKVGGKSKASGEKPILPKNHTDVLVKRIKKLVSMWADEEIMNGNKVFYWNIMNNKAMGTIAAQVPLSIDELIDIGVIGENVVKEYGERLIKNLNAFIEQNGLEKYVKGKENKRRKLDKDTKPAASVSTTKSRVLLDDEFDIDIDFSTIDIPDGPLPTSQAKSSYFNK